MATQEYLSNPDSSVHTFSRHFMLMSFEILKSNYYLNFPPTATLNPLS